MLFTPGTSLIYVSHFLLVLQLLISYHFTTFDMFPSKRTETLKTEVMNETYPENINLEEKNPIRYSIPLVFDEDAIKFEKILIEYLNSYKNYLSQFEFVQYSKDKDYPFNTCIYVMEESHKGLILSQKKDKIDKWKSKFENILIIAFRDGEFIRNLRNLTLSNYQIIEILYMNRDILKESSRNEKFLNSLFNSLKYILDYKQLN